MKYLSENMLKGFTLAEVLITLGIIGIVASMTMPTLLSKYRKNVVISKLQKASSTIAQASNMATATYGTDYREAFDAFDPDSALEMFNKYYKPFMKLSNVVKGQKGVFAYLTDGTALYFFRDYREEGLDGWYTTYMIVCLTHKACETLDETSTATIRQSLGVERFTFYTNGQIPTYQISTVDRDTLISYCKNSTVTWEACSALIGGDGWVIKDDYPLKI